MRLAILGTVLVLGFYAVLCIGKKGEVLGLMSGIVQRCETLGKSSAEVMSHATIKLENGSYVISSLKDCNRDMTVSVYVKRGALYFNTLYATD
jgi:hypothetical protein